MKYKANKQGKKVKVNIFLPQNQYLKQMIKIKKNVGRRLVWTSYTHVDTI